MPPGIDRKSTRLNSSHTEIYTLSLHDALPISAGDVVRMDAIVNVTRNSTLLDALEEMTKQTNATWYRSEEHTSELQSHRDLHSFPTRRSSDLGRRCRSHGRDR